MTRISGLARDCFFHNCGDKITYTQSSEDMIREYDSDARRHAGQLELQTLTIEFSMSERDINDDKTALK